MICLLSRCSLITVTQMATMGKVETHKSVMRFHESLVDLKIGRAAAQALHINAPFLGVQVECLQSTSLASQLDCVDVLISTVISCTWVALGIFV